MLQIKTLLREPALLLNLLENGLVMLIALGIPLSHDSEAAIVAAVVALIGVAKGISTKPFAVHLITDLARALLVLAATFGLNLPADKVTIVVTFIGTLTALIGSIRTTPTYSPVTRVGGAGAGPVANEAGYVNSLFAIGLLIAVIGLLLLVLTTYHLIATILVVVGIVLAIVGILPLNRRL